jgi:hypothetical protein
MASDAHGTARGHIAYNTRRHAHGHAHGSTWTVELVLRRVPVRRWSAHAATRPLQQTAPRARRTSTGSGTPNCPKSARVRSPDHSDHRPDARHGRARGYRAARTGHRHRSHPTRDGTPQRLAPLRSPHPAPRHGPAVSGHWRRSAPRATALRAISHDGTHEPRPPSGERTTSRTTPRSRHRKQTRISIHVTVRL